MHSISTEINTTRWSQKRHYSILQARFDGGRRFIDTWMAWRSDPRRCERLHFVGVGALELASDLEGECAAQLGDAWPEQLAGLHRLEFEGGKVMLTLAFGDISSLLQKIWLRCDAFFLDLDESGVDLTFFTKALARIAADNAFLFARTEKSASLQKALGQTGFAQCVSRDRVLTTQFSPRWKVRRHEPPLPLSIDTERHAIVVGAGLAGCALAERLTSRGWRVSMIDRRGAPAAEASGNPAGVFHPIVWRDDSIASRLTRAGFLYALHQWSLLEHAGHDLKRSRNGLLQIADSAEDARAIADAMRRFGLPASYVKAVETGEATRLAGVEVSRAGWFFPRGGWISPAAICAAQCAAAESLLTRHFNTEVTRIERNQGVWHAFDTHNRPITSAPVLILANAGDAQRLAALHAQPTRGVRGQLTLLDANPLDALDVPIVGDGYAIPLGEHRTLAGATYDLDSTDPELREEGHAENIERVSRMLPALGGFKASDEPLNGRVAFRSVTSDRLPMIGSIADEQAARANAEALSGAWPLDLPRADGLYGAFAFGSRGLIWATLAAELIACQIEGEPWPIERDLAEAIDPGRFLLRALRHGEFDSTCG